MMTQVAPITDEELARLEADIADGTILGLYCDRLIARLRAAEAKLNTPELHDFAAAVTLEGAHQRERWGSEHDAGKSDADWFWLVGYLAGKALHSVTSGNVPKALHHVITTAAALANWHAALNGDSRIMRPGIAEPAHVTGAKNEGKGGLA